MRATEQSSDDREVRDHSHDPRASSLRVSPNSRSPSLSWSQLTKKGEKVTPENPGTAVVVGVERTLELASTWLRWDGAPLVSEDGDRVYTPNKAIRRYSDHLIDHLAQIEALVGNCDSEADGWHGSLVTLASDWAPFTEVDLAEAGQRLTRLARIYVIRLDALGPKSWDESRGSQWTLRQIVKHVAPPWYAEQVGDLRP